MRVPGNLVSFEATAFVRFPFNWKSGERALKGHRWDGDTCRFASFNECQARTGYYFWNVNKCFQSKICKKASLSKFCFDDNQMGKEALFIYHHCWFNSFYFKRVEINLHAKPRKGKSFLPRIQKHNSKGLCHPSCKQSPLRSIIPGDTFPIVWSETSPIQSALKLLINPSVITTTFNPSKRKSKHALTIAIKRSFENSSKQFVVVIWWMIDRSLQVLLTDLERFTACIEDCGSVFYLTFNTF